MKKTILALWMILAIAITSLSFQLTKNQIIVGADLKYPATAMGLTIRLTKLSDGKASATVTFKDSSDSKEIDNQAPGYEISYRNFVIRVHEIGESEVKFFVQRNP